MPATRFCVRATSVEHSGVSPKTESVPGSLAGRSVLVTGASRGIGRAVALRCAAAGAQVIAAARDVPALETLADEIESRGQPEAILLPINLETAGRGDYETIAEHLESRVGRLDGLALIAAALGELAPLASFDPMLWARVFQVNVHSALLLTQACWPLLRAAEDGVIVFTLAGEAFEAKPHWGAYGASKWALRGMFEMWARETANDPCLRVHAIVPPAVHTRLRINAYPGVDAGGLPDPEVVADDYRHVLSAGAVAEAGTVRDCR